MHRARRLQEPSSCPSLTPRAQEPQLKVGQMLLSSSVRSYPSGPHLLPHLLSVSHCRVLTSWLWFSSAHGCPKAKGEHSQVFLLRNWVFLDQLGFSVTSTRPNRTNSIIKPSAYYGQIMRALESLMKRMLCFQWVYLRKFC